MREAVPCLGSGPEHIGSFTIAEQMQLVSTTKTWRGVGGTSVFIWLIKREFHDFSIKKIAGTAL